MNHTVREIDWAAVIIRSCIGTAQNAKPKLSIVNGVAAALPDVFEKYGIVTPRRQAHFLAQSIIECDYFKTLEEYASGDAYDQRTDMGFTAAKDGDGRIHKGYGIFQTTGPNNQRRALKALLALGFQVTQNVVEARSVLTQPLYAAWAAGIFWSDNKMNAIADRDQDGALCSRQVNRGNANAKRPANHEAERKRAFKAAWKELQNPRLLKVAPVRLVDAAAGPDLIALARDVRSGNVIDPAAPVAGEPIDVSGMTSEERERYEVATREMVDSMRANPEMEMATGQAYTGSATLHLQPAPGMDEDEHAAQVRAGLTPDAGPASPSTPLPFEPVTPGIPEALVKATQARLRERGFFGVGGADGQPDWMTVQGIAGYQAVARLPVTGQMDKATLDSIWAADAPSAPISAPRAMTEVKDLKGKSEIIDSAENVKTTALWQGILGGGAGAVTLVMSSFKSVWDEMEPVRAVFADMPVWGWGLIVLVVIGGTSAYSWWKAHRVQVARVDDQRAGKTL